MSPLAPKAVIDLSPADAHRVFRVRDGRIASLEENRERLAPRDLAW